MFTRLNNAPENASHVLIPDFPDLYIGRPVSVMTSSIIKSEKIFLKIPRDQAESSRSAVTLDSCVCYPESRAALVFHLDSPPPERQATVRHSRNKEQIVGGFVPC